MTFAGSKVILRAAKQRQSCIAHTLSIEMLLLRPFGGPEW